MDKLRYALFYSPLSVKIAAAGCFLLAVVFALAGWKYGDGFFVVVSLFMTAMGVCAGRRIRG